MAKTFEVMYQAGGGGTGLTVQYDVYKADKTLDATQSGIATEVGTTGRYHKSFDADGPGWFVEISDNAGGKAVRHIGPPEWQSHGVLDAVADVQTAVDAVAATVAILNTTVSSVEGKTDDILVDTANILTALATIEGKVDAIDQPPMVG